MARRKPNLRERIVIAIQGGADPAHIAGGVGRTAAFVRKVYLEWQRKNLAAAKKGGR
jgi:hypothetical protein